MTVKGAKSSVRTAKNRKVLINRSPLGIPTGVYFVDTYDVYMEAKLPVGALGFPMDSPKCGLDPNSNGSGRRGYAYLGQTGQIFYMKTIAYLIKHNMLGQTLNIWDPSIPNLEWIVKYKY